MASLGSITILVHEWVTGGGLAGREIRPSWLEEGRAIRRALAADFAAVPAPGVRVIMTLDERWSDEAGPWTSAGMGAGDAGRRLIELARQADYTVMIAPETMGVLAGLARDLEDAGVRSLGCSPESIEVTGDKARLGDWLGSRRIRTPTSRQILPRAGLPADFPYPAVLKPIDGAGSVDTFWIADADRLPPDARALPVALLQPFVPGVPMSASFLVSGEGTPFLLGTGRQDVVIRGGRFQYRGGRIPVDCPEAVELARLAIGSVHGLRGFVGVDCLWDPSRGEAVVLEINPRPTTSYVGLSQLLSPGRLARAWLAALGVPGFPPADLTELAGAIERQSCVTFDASGNCRDGEEPALS